MAYYNGREAGVYYNGNISLLLPPKVALPFADNSDEPETPASYAVNYAFDTTTVSCVINGAPHTMYGDAAKTVEAGAKYEAIIVPFRSSHNITHIKVTMGGVDVTSDVVGDYDDRAKQIYIPSVTGDIVIEASANEESGGGEIVVGQLITADGLYFVTEDNKEFVTKENANG